MDFKREIVYRKFSVRRTSRYQVDIEIRCEEHIKTDHYDQFEQDEPDAQILLKKIGFDIEKM